MKMHLGNPFRPRLTFLALAVTLVAAALGLTQCRLSDDSVTGVDVSDAVALNGHKGGGHGHSKCEHQCSHDYKKCRDREDSRYEKAKKACRKMKDSDDRRKCKKAAESQHEKNKDACKAAKSKCKKACDYREGSGKGGR